LLAKGITGGYGEIRVLYVDDDSNQFEFIKFFLNQADPVLIVNCMGTLDEVFRELNTGNYDCLVTDFQMPLMDGIELASKVREKHACVRSVYG
jgi:DNA-binding response OmpR family regulator